MENRTAYITAAIIVAVAGITGYLLYYLFKPDPEGCNKLSPCSTTCTKGICPIGQTCQNGVCVNTSDGCNSTSPCSTKCVNGICPNNEICQNGTCITQTEQLVFSIGGEAGSFLLNCPQGAAGGTTYVQLQTLGGTPNGFTQYWGGSSPGNMEFNLISIETNGQQTDIQADAYGNTNWEMLQCNMGNCPGNPGGSQIMYYMAIDMSNNTHSNVITLTGYCPGNGCC